MAIAQRLEMASRDSRETVGLLDKQLRHTEAVQKSAVWMQDQQIVRHRKDWRSMVVCAVVSIMFGGVLSYSTFSLGATWQEKILSSSDRNQLCQDMGFQVLEQNETDNVCAIAYPRF